ncbi:hypothetical protein GGF44_002528 [Coemansia sp. RSA 1694]|nr:hypothetical protein GGF38_002110 [Coemansia sp. RSA 25]KAJ2640558.1 hypothetical protein GGF44_002528 [Coemansia sp. RSA 1694]
MSVYNQFNYPSPSNSDVCPNTPAFIHDSHLPNLPTASSQITGHANSAVYVYSSNTQANALCRLPVHQLFSTDGRLFIEYKPGHNVVFIANQIEPAGQQPPLKEAIQQAAAQLGIRKQHQQQQQQKPKRSTLLKLGMPKRPHNAFIRYRCRHLQSTKLAHPNASQTDLSRIIAKNWRSESLEIKERLQAEYRAELSHYQDQVKRILAQPLGL